MSAITRSLRQSLAVVLVVLSGSGFASAQNKKITLPEKDVVVIYVVQPSRGMAPLQMKDLLSNYYEYHFRFIKGVRHVESTYKQEGVVIRLHLDPGCDGVTEMDEAIAYIKRSRSFFPGNMPETSILRFETLSIPLLAFPVPIPIVKSVR
jgi:multidrug efflux pump subunit AcrB